MSNIGNIFAGLIIFMTGVAFTYYSYPFMSGFLTAFENVGASFAGWDVIQFIIWGGYWLIILMWVLVFPLMKVVGAEKLNI